MIVSYNKVVEFLIKEFPEFTETEEFRSFEEDDLKLPYVVAASYARYILERFKKYGSNDVQILKLFKFIDNQFSTQDSDPDVLNLISIEIF